MLRAHAAIASRGSHLNWCRAHQGDHEGYAAYSAPPSIRVGNIHIWGQLRPRGQVTILCIIIFRGRLCRLVPLINLHNKTVQIYAEGSRTLQGGRMNSHAWQQPVSSGDAYRRAGADGASTPRAS